MKHHLILVFMAFPFAVLECKADDLLFEGGIEFVNTGLSENFVSGYDFVSNIDQSLTALGFWDANGDGLPNSGSFEIGLWETDSQQLLANVIIDDSDPLDDLIVEGGSWRFEDLTTAVSLTKEQLIRLVFK